MPGRKSYVFLLMLWSFRGQGKTGGEIPQAQITAVVTVTGRGQTNASSVLGGEVANQ